ncbi:alpha-L-rhamnosidase C-terminal domain-containing protein [Oxalobacteraceae bacterium A2-2]
MMSILTDCPHREKLGWLEQNYLNGPALRYNFRVDAILAKNMNDIADAQQETGMVPNIAPEYVAFPMQLPTQFRESAEWGSAYIQVPWQQYLYAGDLGPARAHYAGMARYVDYLQSRLTPQGLLHIPGALGDWYDIGPKKPGPAQLTSTDLTATAIYHDDLAIMERLASLLGKPEDARRYGAMAARVRASFNQAYLRPEGGYEAASQTANAMALSLGLAPDSAQAATLAALVADVQARGLTAGDIGYRYLLRALADGGRSDIVHAITSQSERPGYGYQLAQGATSLAEAWNAEARSSQNHFMLGQINEWFFHDLAGIQPDSRAPGFKHIVIRPALVAGLDAVEASYDSPHGVIQSAWRRTADRVLLEVEIPPNTTATIILPAATAGAITESGLPLDRAPQVRLDGWRDGMATLAVPSGRYRFAVTQPAM